jgi:hypothetical protein
MWVGGIETKTDEKSFMHVWHHMDEARICNNTIEAVVSRNKEHAPSSPCR